MKCTILLPVKDARRAKCRLSTVLNQEERSALAWAMFEDVCAALHRVALPVTVVTARGPAAALATALGWRVLLETEQVSESHSVDAASTQLAQEGFGGVLRLPADIPLVQPRDIEEVAAALPGFHAAVVVPSRDGTGTNAILRSPPGLFPSRFGPDSFSLHRDSAQRAGAAFAVVRNERVGLDVDEPRDVDHLFRQRSDTHTHNLLVKIGWAERMASRAEEHSHPRP